MDQWYRIDHAGKLFPGVTNGSNTSIFRVSMLLKDPVDPEILQRALNTIMHRFPMLAVKMKKGLFWYYLEDNDRELMVRKEASYPCAPMKTEENNEYLLRVQYFNNKISADFFHSITDGTGAIEFLKTLVFEYLKLTGKNVSDDEGIILPPDAFPSTVESLDSFDSCYEASSADLKEPEALHVRGTPFTPYGHNVIHGVLSAAALNGVSKRYGVTITAYLAATLIAAVNACTLPYNVRRKPVVVCIPVNLRKLFPSKSLRNFFAVVNIGIPASDGMIFTDVLSEVAKQMKEKTEKEYLAKEISGSMKYEKNMLSRFVPVRLKEYAIRYGFEHYGEDTKTITLSNIGRVGIPKSMAPCVDGIEATVYPTAKSPVNCAVCSVNDRLTITFARNIMESEIIREFFRLLVLQSGLEVRIISNDWGVSS
jgi:NRPS condensation-like uncharacterized protein